MEYTITKTETKSVKVSPETQIAILEFEKTLRAEKRLKKQEEISTGWLLEVPQEDMSVYMEITNELQKKYQ